MTDFTHTNFDAVEPRGLDGVVELRTVGRRTGLPRRMLVTLMTVDTQPKQTLVGCYYFYEK